MDEMKTDQTLEQGKAEAVQAPKLEIIEPVKDPIQQVADAAPAPKIRIIQDAPATISITRPSYMADVAAAVDTFAVPRNTLMIMNALREKLKDDAKDLAGITIQVSTKAMEIIEKQTTLLDAPVTPKTLDVMMIEGPAQDVLNRLIQMCVPPEYASVAMQQFITDPLVGLTECTSLQIAMITFCFQDKGVGGFTIVNNKIPFTPEAAIMLAEAAAGQIDTFKVEMIKKHNVQFPQDSKIVTPGQVGFDINAGKRKRR